MEHDARALPLVPRWRSAVLESSLTASQKLCLVALAEWADLDGSNCWPSLPSIAQKASVNERTVRRCLDQAAEAGFIVRTNRGTAQGWRRFEYRLSIPQRADTVSTPSSQRADTVSTPSGETCGHSVQDVRTLCPERADTVSTDLDHDLDHYQEEKPAIASPKAKAPRARRQAQTFRQWSESFAPGEDWIPEGHHVHRYIESIGLPDGFADLAWEMFKERHASSRKRQADWPTTFRNCIAGNWYRLWFIDEAGHYLLTTQGKQADRQHGAPAAPEGSCEPRQAA